MSKTLAELIGEASGNWSLWQQRADDPVALIKLDKTQEEAMRLSDYFEGRFDGLCDARGLTIPEDTATTKGCPECGNPMALIRTQNKKMCGCGAIVDWNLDPGQKAVGY